MGSRLISRANGSVHDIGRIKDLSTEPCNLRLLSDRSLYVLINLANEDVNFLSRYGTIGVNNQYFPVTSGSPDEGEVLDTANLIREELQDMSLETSLNNIAESILAIANRQCCDSSGSGGAGESEVPASSGTDNGVSSPGLEWPTYDDYRQDKCNRATYVLAGIEEDVSRLITANWVGILSLPLGEALLALVALLITPIPGDELLGVLAVLSTVSGGFAPIFDAVQNAFNAKEPDILCALFQAGNATEAKDNARNVWGTEVAATTSGIVEVAALLVVDAFITNDTVNPLFDFDYVSIPATADCSACGPLSVTLSFADVGGVPTGSGDLTPDGSLRTLTATNFGSITRLNFSVDQPNANVSIEIDAVRSVGVSSWPTCRLRCEPHVADVWNHDATHGNLGPVAEVGNEYQGASLICNGSPGAVWEMDVRIGPTITGPC